MNKPILQAEPASLVRVRADVVVAGCGVAGLYAALNLDQRLECALLDKAGDDISNSMYAQGGISAVTQYDKAPRASHIADTLTAGAGLCDEAAVKVLVDEAADNVKRLIALGVPFDRAGGELLRTREGGHSERRILHCGGDATGLHLTSALLEQAKTRDNLHFYHGMLLTDILTDGYGVTGVLALRRGRAPILFETRRVILATGGPGRAYHASTSAVCATGDGMAAAARAGVPLKDMEFVQFHPTALIGEDASGRSFLISEAMRGEGAVLRNAAGEAFMRDVHPLADLAPRDIVARAIVREMQRTGESHVYLDITAHPGKFLEARFPTIYAECMGRGIDIAREWIPVHPVQHYMMGGVRTGLFGETELPGLYACGETACTGVHGANRLASNSLLECVVFGRRAALHCADLALPEAKARYAPEGGGEAELPSYADTVRGVRDAMSAHCGIVRDAAGLTAAIARLGELEWNLLNTRIESAQAAEALNLAQVSLAIATAALARKGSAGAHYRSDGNV